MKILHINTEKTWRGGEQQVLYLVKGLRDRGYESGVICQPNSPLAERAKAEKLWVDEVRMRGGVDPCAIFSVAKLLRRGYDILHLHTSNAHTLGLLASMLTKGHKTVVSRRVSFPIKHSLRRLKYMGVDKVIAVSEDIRESLIHYGIPPQLVVTIHSAIDLNRYKKRNCEPSEPVVGIIAHLAEHKGHRYFLEAAKEVSAIIPTARFLVIGDGEKREELERYAKNLDIAERISFLGFQKDIPQAVSLCTITVLSSISGEGSPGVLKESMATGVPVITTDVGGSAEIVKDGITGLVVPPMNSKALALAMIKLLTDDKLRKNLARKGLRKVNEFSVDRMVEKTEAVYKSLLS
ncbi:MAG: glycosyltransferase [Candidatus Jettenia caeni]|nr:MAG: glycosyltransferase [Candidatus Jettenia caeni]